MRFTKEQVRLLNALHQKKGRDDQQLFLAEGGKLVAELVESNFLVHHLYTETPLPASLRPACPVSFLEKGQLQRITALDTAPPMVAVVRMPAPYTSGQNEGWTLALDGIQNPGNMGAILRVADWYGITELVCSPACADVFAPKVVQASMGSIVRTRVVYTELDAYFEGQSRPVFGAVLQGTDVKSISSSASGILLIGNEGQGISASLTPYITHKVSIVRKGGAESLNAAVAAGILIDRLLG